VKKKEQPLVLGRSESRSSAIGTSRKEESRYGVIISSTENNKTNTRVRILFFPYGKIEEVTKSRLDFAEPPADIDNASLKFLENYIPL
jgi:hypothetical protein